MKKSHESSKSLIRLTFIGSTAIILLLGAGIMFTTQYFLIELGLINAEQDSESGAQVFLLFIAASVLIGLILSFLVSKIVLKPVNRLLDGMDKLASGDFKTRVDFRTRAMDPVKENFNNLASQLEKTEILRSDFINNFSHEFKTPLVSVSGLVRLMKNGNLSKEKQMEYLNIIEEEVGRLAAMTTNVLNLTRLENQSILGEKTTFNVSEQIRTCVLLLQRKWEEKNLELQMDFEEFSLTANEDALKQVWMNLLDNGIKFSDDNGKLQVFIEEMDDDIVVRVSNTGAPIAKGDEERIFQKFYRGENHRFQEGNGIGLSIAKKIVNLHGGEIWAKSQGGMTTFAVRLPK